MIRSLAQYTRLFATGLLDPDVRQLLLAHAGKVRAHEGPLDEAVPQALVKVMDHLAHHLSLWQNWQKQFPNLVRI